MELLRLSDVSIREAAKKAAHALAGGSLIIYPTDTLYGIGADAENPLAIRGLKALKGRESKKPISIILSDVSRIKEYAVLSDTARSIAERFFPGALTLVVPAKPIISAELTFNGNIGIRIPNDPFCLELAREFGAPFTATSANRSGRETPRTVHAILKQFGHDVHDVDVAIDDGERGSGHGQHSTVVLCVGDTAHILREGAISREQLGL